MTVDLLFRNLFPLNSKPGCTSPSVRRVRETESEDFVAVQKLFGERIDSREGGGDRLLPLASCANLRRSKLLKYWCNTHVSRRPLQNQRSTEVSTVERNKSGVRASLSGPIATRMPFSGGDLQLVAAFVPLDPARSSSLSGHYGPRNAHVMPIQVVSNTPKPRASKAWWPQIRWCIPLPSLI